MTTMNDEAIRAVLQNTVFPMLQISYGALGAIDSITRVNGRAQVELTLGMFAKSQLPSLEQALQLQLESAGVDAAVVINSVVKASPRVNTAGKLAGVKNIIMVASGKGGVGKSTTAVNLALALRLEGARVGILDADIYGPSQHVMLGVPAGTKPELVDNKYLQPITRMGLKSMSVGYLSAEKTPMIWRGSMAVKALQQLLEQTLWGELDYLIIDMPPGTGDIQISLAQKLSVAGAVVVSTPQEIALIDARKGVEMFTKVDIPILGVVENMAVHVCSACGHEESIFGCGGAAAMAADYGVSLLGSLPLDRRIRQGVDDGLPTVVADPGSALARSYLALANQVAAQQWQTNLQRMPAPTLVVTEA